MSHTRLFKSEPGKALAKKLFEAGTGDKRDKIIQKILKQRHGKEKLQQAYVYLEKQSRNVPTNINQSMKSIEMALEQNNQGRITLNYGPVVYV